MSHQELSDTVRALIAQVAQLSSALDNANNKLDSLQQTCDGAWTRISERIDATEVKITYFMDNVRGNGGKTMKLVNETAIAPTVYSNDRKDWTTWSRTMKAYLDCRYSGFRKMLEWAETCEEEVTLEMIDGTGWSYARESNGQLYNFLLTVTKL